jgi:hypothetical protein
VKLTSTHMITGLKQVLWRNRHLIVMAPESDAVHVVVFEETLRGPLRRESHRFKLDGGFDETKTIGGLADWERFVGHHLDDSWIIILPHQVTISQWMDLDSAQSDQLEKRLEEQTQQLVGLGESKIVVDYVEVPSSKPNRSSYWITYCQESEVHKIIDEFGLSNVAICDVIADADALFAGLQSTAEIKDQWLMLDVRDGGTSTIVFEGSYPRYCSFFPVGNEMAKEQGTRSRGPIRVGIGNEGSEGEMQRIRKGIPEVVSEWTRDIHRAWQEYRVSILKDHESSVLDCPVLLLADVPVLSTWGTAAKDSLQVSLLKEDAVWPEPVANLEPDERRHWGAVLANHRKNVAVPSLLPESVKTAWNEKQVGIIWRSLALLSCVFAMVVMLMAVIQKGMLWNMKTTLIEEVKDVEFRFDQSLVVLEGLKQEYRMLQPLIQAEQNTHAVIEILGAMQQIRTNQNGWMVLLADKDSYYANDGLSATNATTSTNLVSFPSTNRVHLRRGFILELVLNSEGEAMRQELAEVVTFLRDQDFLFNADTLPADTRRPLVSSNLIVLGKHFAVSLEMDGLESEKNADALDSDGSDATGYRPVWRNLQPNISQTTPTKEGGP